MQLSKYTVGETEAGRAIIFHFCSHYSMPTNIGKNIIEIQNLFMRVQHRTKKLVTTLKFVLKYMIKDLEKNVPTCRRMGHPRGRLGHQQLNS